jgi:hypothetical protein
MATNPVKTRRLVLRGLAVLALVSVGALPGALAQDIEVTSADPSAAEQATVNLDVTIHGKGFARGAVAEFLLTGTENPGGIIVNRTTFKGSKKLIANIDIEEDAVVGGFDIEVMSNGRTGKGIDAFSVLEKGTGNVPQDTLARGDFRDAGTDAITSDGIVLPAPCNALGYDYVAREDPCYGGTGNGLRTSSKVMAGGTYFLRTVSTNALVPDRWLVLDFSNTVGECPGLDTQLKGYNGRDPDAVSYEDPDPCVDLLEVRFFARDAFEPGALETEVDIIIDGPDLVGKQKQQRTQWNGKFYLEFVNLLTVTPHPTDPETLTVGTDDDDFLAELWTVNQKNGKKDKLLGFYDMPFQLTITNLPWQ